MINTVFSTKDVVKYLIIIGLVYAILKLFPSQQISTKDLILIMIIITICFIYVEVFIFKKIDQPTSSQPITNEPTPSQPVIESKPEPKISCAIEIEKVKNQINEEINVLKSQLDIKHQQSSISDKIADKYFESLMTELLNKGLLNKAEIDNIKLKLQSKLLTLDEIINSLELLKKQGKTTTKENGIVQNDEIYNELHPDYLKPIGDKIANEWANDYAILNTDKWRVPMPTPPVCINTQPCPVCPTTSDTVVSLKHWDESRYVEPVKVNKKWTDDQVKI